MRMYTIHTELVIVLKARAGARLCIRCVREHVCIQRVYTDD